MSEDALRDAAGFDDGGDLGAAGIMVLGVRALPLIGWPMNEWLCVYRSD